MGGVRLHIPRGVPQCSAGDPDVAWGGRRAPARPRHEARRGDPRGRPRLQQRGATTTPRSTTSPSTLGVTKPTVYYYVPNKEQLLFECFRAGLEPIREALRARRAVRAAAAATACADVVARLRARDRVRLRLVHGARRAPGPRPGARRQDQGAQVGNRPGHPPPAARGTSRRLDRDRGPEARRRSRSPARSTGSPTGIARTSRCRLRPSPTRSCACWSTASRPVPRPRSSRPRHAARRANPADPMVMPFAPGVLRRKKFAAYTAPRRASLSSTRWNRDLMRALPGGAACRPLAPQGNPDMTESLVIVAARRTPIGAFQGVLAPLTATQLGAIAAKAALADAGVAPDALDEVIFGCVLPAGLGQAPARQAAVGAGVAASVPATTVNKMCGSGMKAVMLAGDQIRAGSAGLVLAGGLESMSNAPYLMLKARAGYRMGHAEIFDHMFYDGLQSPWDGKAMGCFADVTAAKYGYSRARPGRVRGRVRAPRAARRARRRLRRRDRAGHGEDAQGRTAGHAGRDALRARHREDPVAEARVRQGRHRHRGVVVVDFGRRRRHRARRRIRGAQRGPRRRSRACVAYASHAQAPEWFTTAPAPSIRRRSIAPAGRSSDVDLFEINEAFACVTMVAMQDLGLPHDTGQRERRRLRARPPDRRDRRAPDHDAGARLAQARPAPRRRVAVHRRRRGLRRGNRTHRVSRRKATPRHGRAVSRPAGAADHNSSNDEGTDPSMQLNDKVVVVTGGARGIGKAIATAFADKGARSRCST